MVPTGPSEQQQAAGDVPPALGQAGSPAPLSLHAPQRPACLLASAGLPPTLSLPHGTPGMKTLAWVPVAFCLGHPLLCLMSSHVLYLVRLSGHSVALGSPPKVLW